MSTAQGGGGGAIVNVSSIAAVFGGLHGDTVYAASKGAVDAFTRGLAKEVAGEGIRVCAVRPGLILPAGARASGVGPKSLCISPEDMSHIVGMDRDASLVLARSLARHALSSTPTRILSTSV